MPPLSLWSWRQSVCARQKQAQFRPPPILYVTIVGFDHCLIPLRVLWSTYLVMPLLTPASAAMPPTSQATRSMHSSLSTTAM